MNSDGLDTYLNPITIDMFGNCFYHKGKYAGDDNIYFLVNHTISEYCKLFIACCIDTQCKDKYNFTDQFKQRDLDKLTIMLPSKIQSDETLEVDYEKMEKIYKKYQKNNRQRIDTFI